MNYIHYIKIILQCKNIKIILKTELKKLKENKDEF